MTTQYGTWVSYGGTARLLLVIILLAAAGVLAYSGTRFRGLVALSLLPDPGPRRSAAFPLFRILGYA